MHLIHILCHFDPNFMSYNYPSTPKTTPTFSFTQIPKSHPHSSSPILSSPNSEFLKSHLHSSSPIHNQVKNMGPYKFNWKPCNYIKSCIIRLKIDNWIIINKIHGDFHETLMKLGEINLGNWESFGTQWMKGIHWWISTYIDNESPKNSKKMRPWSLKP